MHKKKYKAIIPSKVKDINAVNSLLIKLRYYWEMVEVHKRHNEKPDEVKYEYFLKNLKKLLDKKYIKESLIINSNGIWRG